VERDDLTHSGEPDATSRATPGADASRFWIGRWEASPLEGGIGSTMNGVQRIRIGVARAAALLATLVAPMVGGPLEASQGSTIHGGVLLDEDRDFDVSAGDRPVIGVPVRVSGAGVSLEMATPTSGAFNFGGLPAGTYTVAIGVPGGVVPMNGTTRVVALDGRDGGRVDFFLTRGELLAEEPLSQTPSSDIPRTTLMLADTARSPLPRPAAAPGFLGSPSGIRATRDAATVWLGVPFLSQLDGSPYAGVNCGPASVAMVLNAFGVRQSPGAVRELVNGMTGNYSTGVGTSLDHLGQVVGQAGLEVIDLHAESGGYQRWGVEQVRAHLQAGHPVVTLVKYRLLPSSYGARAQFDHYVVITGLAGDNLVYSDPAFTGEHGSGLVISPSELERAWDYSSIPRHGMAVALPGGS
jgi:predicted double-glycine peptidase